MVEAATSIELMRAGEVNAVDKIAELRGARDRLGLYVRALPSIVKDAQELAQILEREDLLNVFKAESEGDASLPSASDALFHLSSPESVTIIGDDQSMELYARVARSSSKRFFDELYEKYISAKYEIESDEEETQAWDAEESFNRIFSLISQIKNLERELEPEPDSAA